MYQSSGFFFHSTPLRLCPSNRKGEKMETVMESILVCSSIIDSCRHAICMQMNPHLALDWTFSGVLGAICHSVYLTRLFHSLTCPSCTSSHPCGSSFTGRRSYVYCSADRGEWTLDNSEKLTRTFIPVHTHSPPPQHTHRKSIKEANCQIQPTCYTMADVLEVWLGIRVQNICLVFIFAEMTKIEPTHCVDIKLLNCKINVYISGPLCLH